MVLAGVVCIVGGLVCEAILEAAKANRAPPTFFTHVVGFLALFGLALILTIALFGQLGPAGRPLFQPQVFAGVAAVRGAERSALSDCTRWSFGTPKVPRLVSKPGKVCICSLLRQ